MLFAQDAIAVDAFVQYGCFGLLAALVVWSVWKGIPNALEIHRHAMADLTATFQKESEECRAERIDVAKTAADEREKDREARHDLANKLQELIAVTQSGSRERK